MSYSLPMKPSEDKKVLERSLAKRYFKKPYDRFMWWRSYTPKNKPLDKRCTFIDKIINGDYDVGPYLKEIELVKHRMNEKWLESVNDWGKWESEVSVDRARMKRLLEDHEKEESRKLDEIKRGFLTTFKITSEQYDKEVVNTSSKDLTAFYFKIETKYGTYWQPMKMPNNLTNQSIY